MEETRNEDLTWVFTKEDVKGRFLDGILTRKGVPAGGYEMTYEYKKEWRNDVWVCLEEKENGKNVLTPIYGIRKWKNDKEVEWEKGGGNFSALELEPGIYELELMAGEEDMFI